MIVPRHLSEDSKLTLDSPDVSLSAAMKEAQRESEMLREIQRESEMMKEIQKEVSAVDDIKRAIGVTNPLSEIGGISSRILDDLKRQDEMLKYATGGIVSAIRSTSSPVLDMIREIDERKSMMKSVIAPFTVPDYAPQRIPEGALFIPPPNPVYKTNEQIQETNAHLQKTVERLEEIVAQSKDTTAQNTRMIRLSVASLIFTIIGIILGTLIGYLSYQAGKNSMTAPVTVQISPQSQKKTP